MTTKGTLSKSQCESTASPCNRNGGHAQESEIHSEVRQGVALITRTNEDMSADSKTRKKGKCATEALNKGAFLTVGATCCSLAGSNLFEQTSRLPPCFQTRKSVCTQPKETRDSEQCDLLRRSTVQPHPLLPVILLETEEFFISEHDAPHVNTRATFRQHSSLPKFQTWKKLLAKSLAFLLVDIAQAKRAHPLYGFFLELCAQVTTDRGPR